MKKHLLIVDDEADIRELLVQYLTMKGFRLTAVGTALEAEHVVRSDPPDLIISDLQLDYSDGLAMIAGFKSALPKVPVILLTGVLFDPQVVQETLSDKISCYLLKTTPLNRVYEEVARLVGA